MKTEQVEAVILGHAVGDALGVPVEFASREKLRAHPVREMRGYGTYDVPAGAWSDDTSMTLGTLASIARLGRVDARDIMQNFARWLNESAFTPTGETFDIGRTTLQAIGKFFHGEEPLLCGGRSEYDNGNGSLMRMAPVALFAFAWHGTALTEEDLRTVHAVSSLTHGHPLAQLACGIYTFILVRLLAGEERIAAVEKGLAAARSFYQEREVYAPRLRRFARLFAVTAFRALPEESIKSSGFVVDTLEAALWCFLTTDSYRSCVERAVNLGEDTDTVAAVAGSLAGAAYGRENIPSSWLDALLRRDLLEHLSQAFAQMTEKEA